MSIIEVKSYQFQCERCGHVWFPRQPVTDERELDLPKTCPHCKSPYWNSPRKNKRHSSRGEKAESESVDE